MAAILSLTINKTDKNDALGLLQMHDIIQSGFVVVRGIRSSVLGFFETVPLCETVPETNHTHKLNFCYFWS